MSIRYLILYPDGSRDKVNQDKHKEMLRAGVLKPVDGYQFRYTGEMFRFRSLAELGLFKLMISTTRFLGNYPGLFIWMHHNKRRKELLESPEKMAERLKLQCHDAGN